MKNAIKVFCFVIAFILVGTCGTWFWFTWDKSDFNFENGSEKGTVIITGYKGESKNVVIPDRLRGKKVVKIDEDVFSETEIVSVTLGKYITAISKSAFSDCEALAEVNLDSKLKSIGESCFLGCKSLTELKIPASVEKIDDAAFINSGIVNLDLSSNDNFVIEDGVLYNKDKTELYMALSCADLTDFECPDSVTLIRPYAFFGHSEMKTIKLSSVLKKIDYATFLQCSSLKELYVPDSVESIAELALSESGIERVYITKNTRKIDKMAFYKLEEQLTVVAPEGSVAYNFAEEHGFKVETNGTI